MCTTEDPKFRELYVEGILQPGSWRVCLHCSGAKKKDPMVHCAGEDKKDPATQTKLPAQLWCASCGVQQKRSNFESKEVEKLFKLGRLASAKCCTCEPRGLETLKGKLLRCMVCKREKTAEHFSIAYQKRAAGKQNYTDLRCKDCQEPPCSKCGERPETELKTKQIPKTLAELQSFMCDKCLYPPCSGCQKAMSKMQRTTHRGKDTWLCAECAHLEQRRRDDCKH